MASSDWYLTNPEWANPGKAPIMSVPCVTMPNMNATLVRLTELASAHGPNSTVDFIDELNTYSVQLCQRPGDWQRVASNIHQLIEEVLRCQHP